MHRMGWINSGALLNPSVEDRDVLILYIKLDMLRRASYKLLGY